MPEPTTSENILERLFDKTIPEPNSGCWLWMGAGTAYHGKMRTENLGYDFAHRVAFRLLKGPIPDGLVVMHECDVGFCVNPDHLRAGTHSENIRDAYRRGLRKPTPYETRMAAGRKGAEKRRGRPGTPHTSQSRALLSAAVKEQWRRWKESGGVGRFSRARCDCEAAE